MYNYTAYVKTLNMKFKRQKLTEFLESKGFTAEANGLRNGDTTLNLNNKNLGDEEAKAIDEGLKTNTSITTLYLHSNQIGAEGAKAIGEGLKTNNSITYLDLGGNNIGDEEMKPINEYLQRNINISKEDNPQAEELNTQGNVFSSKREYDKAIEKYNEAIAIIKNPLYIANKINAEKKYEQQQQEIKAEGLNAEGNILVENEKYIEATEKYEAAIAIINKPLYVTNKENAEKKYEEQKAELEIKKQEELLAKQKQEQEIQQLNKLLSAIQNNKLEDAEKLIQSSNIQTLSKIDENGNTILHYVAEKNILKLYKLLAEVAQELVNATSNKNEAALEILTKIQQEKQKMEEIMMKNQNDIQEIHKLITDGYAKIKDPIKNGILIFGKTGAGKSALTYYLAGEKLKVNKKVLEIEENKIVDNIKINHTTKSETKIPGKYKLSNTTIVDLPGFEDTGCIVQEIANAFYIKRLFETTNHMKFILAIEETSLTRKDELINIIKQFAKTFTNIEPLKKSLSLFNQSIR
ncbi:50S ribosome-binding GTPase [Rickettsia hoogstraalii]|uniref:GTPase n=1 Tax=Rickettsia hoogstraalii TaxID=467174 RepID=UPI00224FD4E0|nr:GTPase [Rickettsia hoogstraalii]MCX4084239.1 50S ribosome-binding GTPase [Rickettsia hoogstraalii]